MDEILKMLFLIYDLKLCCVQIDELERKTTKLKTAKLIVNYELAVSNVIYVCQTAT